MGCLELKPGRLSNETKFGESCGRTLFSPNFGVLFSFLAVHLKSVEVAINSISPLHHTAGTLVMWPMF